MLTFSDMLLICLLTELVPIANVLFLNYVAIFADISQTCYEHPLERFEDPRRGAGGGTFSQVSEEVYFFLS